jgi:hypothetical protein
MASKRRKVESEEAGDLIAEWRASGESLRSWCARRGIDGRSLRYWADRDPQAPILRLVELTPARRRARPSGVRLRVRGVTIGIGSEFSDEVLIRVIQAVRAC